MVNIPIKPQGLGLKINSSRLLKDIVEGGAKVIEGAFSFVFVPIPQGLLFEFLEVSFTK